MELRQAKAGDLTLLARWNRELIERERADDTMTPPRLEARLRGWLARAP